MSKNDLVAVVAGFTAALLVITIPVFTVVTNSTERTVACIESGGAYVNVPNTTRMECTK